MPRMVRKQVYLDARQDRLLKRRAKQLGVTEAELIRQSLDRNLLAASAGRPDPSAWDELMRFFRQRSRLKVPQSRRTWTRAELYDRPRAYR